MSIAIGILWSIPFRLWTSEDVDRVRNEQVRTVRIIWLVLFFWIAVIPFVFIVSGGTSVWVARLVLAYSLWKIFVYVLKLSGKWEKSKREREREQEELQKEHHHYHCKLNPEGFLRLKIENIENKTRERVRKEAEALKRISALKQ